LLSIGFSNWSPHSHVDPEPYIEAGYWGEHHKFTAGVAHADFRNEAILGYARDFNDTWRVQVDFQSGSWNSSTIGFVWSITDDIQINPVISMSLTTVRTKCSVMFPLLTHFTSGAAGNNAAQFVPETSR